jgi:hypothetical protein
VNNNFCPEYDTYEGNKYTMVSTLHTCDYVPPNYYSNCDRGGCGSNAYNVDPNMVGQSYIFVHRAKLIHA